MNKRGQSIIEYVLIATLVVLGIVFMGPYVLRSVNAHFKLWDTGIKDSFEENLKQAPVNALPAITEPPCICPPTTGSCGSSLAGSQCPAYQRIAQYICNRPKCDPKDGTYTCENDDTCCTTYSQTPNCGRTPIGQTPAPNDCNYGQRIWATQCPGKPIQCNTDHTCDAQCQGTLASITTACPDTTTGLDQNYDITYVTDQTACDSTKKCQYYCTGGGTVIGGACSCPAGSYNQGACDTGYYWQSGCPAGYYCMNSSC